MSERAFATANLSDVTRREGWIQIRKHFGIDAFGVNAWKGDEAGAEVIPEHDETSVEHEELYFVVSGRATFTIAGESVDAPAGTLLFVRDPSLRRGAIAADAGTTVLTIGAKPGEAFSVSTWEALGEYFEQGDYASAKEHILKQLEREPDRGGHLYNLACAEARLGETDAALEHLGRAVELEERFREYARTDADLDSIRDDPRFPR
jgi:tetratricopeptide (TPR) repeat protein